MPDRRIDGLPDREERRRLLRERTSGYRVDRDGRWWYRGAPLDPGIERQFAAGLERLPDGRLRVICEEEPCYVTCDDAPFVVRDLRRENAAAAGSSPRDRIVLMLSGGLEEPLDPATLHLNPRDVLYCRVRGGAFEARFGASSATRIADMLRPHHGGWAIDLEGRTWVIPARPAAGP